MFSGAPQKGLVLFFFLFGCVLVSGERYIILPKQELPRSFWAGTLARADKGHLPN